MLLLFCLNESAIYVFDSLKKERKIRLTTPARMYVKISNFMLYNYYIEPSPISDVMKVYVFYRAFKLYVPQGGLKNNRKEFIWHPTEVQV